jgi:hypothetical protein
MTFDQQTLQHSMRRSFLLPSTLSLPPPVQWLTIFCVDNAQPANAPAFDAAFTPPVRLWRIPPSTLPLLPSMQWYRQARQQAIALQQALFRRVDRPSVQACAERLGLWRDGAIVVRNELEMAVLVDYCVYNHMIDGRMLVDVYLEEMELAEDSQERELLEAMNRNYYSMFVVEAAEREKGAGLRDLLRDEKVLVVDWGVELKGEKGMRIASRLLPFPDYDLSITSGAALHISPDSMRDVVTQLAGHFTGGVDIENLPADKRAELEAIIIRTLLEREESLVAEYM